MKSIWKWKIIIYGNNMKTKITHLIISLIFAVILGYMASIATIMIIPITGYILTAMAQIMDNNFDITIRILC